MRAAAVTPHREEQIKDKNTQQKLVLFISTFQCQINNLMISVSTIVATIKINIDEAITAMKRMCEMHMVLYIIYLIDRFICLYIFVLYILLIIFVLQQTRCQSVPEALLTKTQEEEWSGYTGSLWTDRIRFPAGGMLQMFRGLCTQKNNVPRHQVVVRVCFFFCCCLYLHLKAQSWPCKTVFCKLAEYFSKVRIHGCELAFCVPLCQSSLHWKAGETVKQSSVSLQQKRSSSTLMRLNLVNMEALVLTF